MIRNEHDWPKLIVRARISIPSADTILLRGQTGQDMPQFYLVFSPNSWFHCLHILHLKKNLNTESCRMIAESVERLWNNVAFGNWTYWEFDQHIFFRISWAARNSLDFLPAPTSFHQTRNQAILSDIPPWNWRKMNCGYVALASENYFIFKKEEINKELTRSFSKRLSRIFWTSNSSSIFWDFFSFQYQKIFENQFSHVRLDSRQKTQWPFKNSFTNMRHLLCWDSLRLYVVNMATMSNVVNSGE